MSWSPILKAVVAAILFYIVYSVAIASVLFVERLQCEAHQGQGYPKALIYPDATLVSEGVNSDPDYLYIAAGYTSEDSFDEIVAFYEDHTFCYGITEGKACNGKANPSGEYMIYINGESYIEKGYTEFGVFITWDSCR